MAGVDKAHPRDVLNGIGDIEGLPPGDTEYHFCAKLFHHFDDQLAACILFAHAGSSSVQDHNYLIQ